MDFWANQVASSKKILLASEISKKGKYFEAVFERQHFFAGTIWHVESFWGWNQI